MNMKSALGLVFVSFLSACFSGNPSSAKVTESKSETINVLDSLKKGSGLGSLVVRTYQGELPVDSLRKTECTITLYNYRHSGDGVYTMTQSGKNETVDGRLYTLRGDADDENATVYQLIPFSGGERMNFRYTDNSLEHLNQNFERTGTRFSLIRNQ